MDALKFTFNTGRQYQPTGHKFAGQVIDVELTTDGVVKFWDRSRNLDGAFYLPTWVVTPDQLAVREEVMAHYDNNNYRPIDYFEYSRARGVQS